MSADAAKREAVGMLGWALIAGVVTGVFVILQKGPGAWGEALSSLTLLTAYSVAYVLWRTWARAKPGGVALS